MRIKTEKRCGCRDENGRKYPRGTCPKLDQRKHGTWNYRFRVPKGLVALVGKTELSSSGYVTKKAAEEAAEEAMATVRTGQQHIGALTVGAYLWDWHSRKNALRPTTRSRYEQFIRLHLDPFLGEMPLSGLRAEHIDAALKRAVIAAQERPGRPVGPATARDVLKMLRAALNDAKRQRMIPFNPADGVDLPSHQAPEVEPWEAAEVGRFLDEAAGDRLSAAYELIALHGLRRGEVCGATWAGLDEAAGVLTIRQQITRSGAALGVWPPKTKSGRRKVDLAAVTVGSLGAHRLRQDDERAAIGDGWDNGVLPDEHGVPVQLRELIFTHPSGRHLAPEYLTRQMQRIARRVGLLGNVRASAPSGATTLTIGTRYRPAQGTWTLYRDREPIGEVTVSGATQQGARSLLHLAGPLPVALAVGDEIGEQLLSPKRLHDLRHGSASIMLGGGIDITTVSKILGHSSTSMTGNTYAHLLRSTGQQAAEMIAAAIPRAVRRGHPAGTSSGETGGAVTTNGV
ncbi:tyrosine-type recombinase/integrase [Frankia sp. CiP3]|uniref:tyrosine-type recombinase/integrase n=1 Tax=Frankia sp. CiP3 TaxID=2880971 RepID=UPI001EF6AF15|nr:tyrosine-type recombinase/integrase [Frankia sp. CiP3]